MTKTPKRMNSEKQAEHLPVSTQQGCIVGQVTPDYLIGLVIGGKKAVDVSKCCQDVRCWKGSGDVHTLRGPEDISDSIPEYSRVVDPCYWLGYRHYRGVVCGHCGTAVNAHEYMR